MEERPRRTNRPIWSYPSRQFCYGLSLIPIGFGLVTWLGYAHSSYGALIAVVVSFLTAVVVAVPWALYRLLSGDQKHRDEAGLIGWLEGYLEIATGRLRAKEFALQALIAPTAALLGLAAIAVVLALVST
jgi:hypothetical protein